MASRSSSSLSSSLRRCSTASRSSMGSGCSDNHTRPLRPKRSAAGHCGIKCAANTEWISFFSRVRWRTIWERRATCRRSAWVRSSGIHTCGRKPLAYSWARIAASILSVLTRASAISRTCTGLAMTTLATWGLRAVTIAAVLPVASRTTASLGCNPWANRCSGSCCNMTRPPERTWPSSR